MLEKTLVSPLDSKEIPTINLKGNQHWILIGRADAESEAPIVWVPDVKSQLIVKNLDAGKDCRQEKGTTEDEMVGWHYQLNGREFEQSLEYREGQGSLAFCSSWGWKELDMTQQLNNNKKVPKAFLVKIVDFTFSDLYFWNTI